MKLKKLPITFIFLSFIAVTGISQIKPADKEVLKNQLLIKINELRKYAGVDTLSLDKRLEKPAEVQSFYMSKNNKLTHSQDNPLFNSPKKRIEHFTPNKFDMFGENVLFTERVKFPLSKKEIIELANEMFQSWKDSPSHYANMVEKDFDSANFGFRQTNSKQIYATNVFGRKGIKIENQLSDNQFGLTTEGNCFKEQKYFSNILVNIGNAISIQGNKVVLYYHDKRRFFDLFSGVRDGIAVDIIDQNQFACNQSNRLDISPIHDGVLLKPVYRDQLMKINRAESDYRIIADIGVIPDHLVAKDFTIVVLLIQNGVVCRLVIPSHVPSASYPLKPLKVNLDNPENVILSESKQVKSITLPFHFKANQTTPVEFPNHQLKGKKVLAVKIKSYSSIEGTEKKNAMLHTQRANVIENHLLKTLNVSSDIFETETKENWDEFYFQLKYLFLDSLLTKNKEELRNFASEKLIPQLPWDSLLYEQRKSTATIYYESKSKGNESIEERNLNNLRYALLNNDIPLAQKALYEMYTNENSNLEALFEESIFEELTKEIDLVQNTSALLIKTHKLDLKQSIRFINKWLVAAEKLSSEAKFNLLNIYTILNYRLLQNWDLSSKRLANVIHPKYVDQVSRTFSSNELMLNLHLTFIKYFGQINDSPNISKSFKFISTYFSERALEIEDQIALAKFYNNWSRYDLTNDYLLRKFYAKELNEEAVFLLLQTLTHYDEDGGVDDYEELYQEALKLNQKRWCEWVNENIQLLRHRNLKKLFCETCN